MTKIALTLLLVAGICSGCSSTEKIVYPDTCDVESTISEELMDGLKVAYGDNLKVQPPDIIGGIKQLQDNIEYPIEARKKGVEATMNITFLINRNGEAINIEPDKDSLGFGFDTAASSAVRKTKYKPAKINGEPYCTPMNLPIRFNLRD